MFCALTKQYGNTDHVVLQVSCYKLDKLTMTKNEEIIEIPYCKYSFIISGGFEPGVYSITSQNYPIQFFIMQEGKELKSGIVNGTLTIKIDRYRYVIL